MVPIRVAESSVEPVSVAELRLYLRLDPDDHSEDGLLADLVAAARAGIEAESRRILRPATFRLILAAWPWGWLAVPLSPLVAVTRLALSGPAGATPLDPGLVHLGDDPIEAPGLAIDPAAPALDGRSVLIELSAGYGGDGPALPPPLRLAVLRLAAARYEHRGDEPDPPDPAALAAPFRRLRL
jgi:uncharacterized phiE125 gp8 family phage protein